MFCATATGMIGRVKLSCQYRAKFCCVLRVNYVMVVDRGLKNWGRRRRALLGRGVVDPLKYAHPTCYSAEFGRCRSHRMGVGRGSQIFLDAGALLPLVLGPV